MDFLQSILFESPIWLGVFSFLMFAAVLFARRRLTDKSRAYALPGTLLLTVLLFLLQWLVVTERERILESLDAFVAGLESENEPAWSRVVGEGYRGEGMDRNDVLAYIESALDSVDVYDTRTRRRDVQIDGDSAEMILVAMATVKIGGGVGEFHVARWKIGWGREPDGWKIVSLRPEKIDTIPIRSLGELRGHIP